MESTKQELAKHLEEAEFTKSALRKELDQVLGITLIACLVSQ